jgi:hypothetical protein
MKKPLRVAIGIVIAAGLTALLVWGFLRNRAELEEERKREEPVKPPQRVEMDRDGEPIITLDAETMERIDLGTVTLTAKTLARAALGYGRLEADPSRGTLLRAPFAGVLRAPAGGEWPSFGAEVAEGAEVALLAPRLAAVERVDIATRLAAARADASSADAAAAAARAALSRAEVLNADKSVSDRALEDARARLRSEEARLAAAQESERLLSGALSGATATAAPLRAERAGEVVEVLAQPGEAVESGQPILRLARFDRLLARVELPLGTHADGAPARAQIAVAGREEAPLPAEVVARAGAVDPAGQAEGFLLRIAPGALPLRPGAAVVAWIELAGPPLEGVIVPGDAVVRTAGSSWAYVVIGPDVFSRRALALDHPVEGGFFAERGFAPGERIVASGAGTLLSEELKPTIDIGD